MTEHKQLKEICDKIWYEVFESNDWYWHLYKCWNIILDVREIIFTQDFMDKLYQFIEHDEPLSFLEYWNWLLHNLDNPVQYLYNLIK